MNRNIKILIIIVMAISAIIVVWFLFQNYKNNSAEKTSIKSGDQELFHTDKYDLRKDNIIFDQSGLGKLSYQSALRNFNLTVYADDADFNYFQTQIQAEKKVITSLGLTQERYCALVIPVISETGLDIGSMLCNEEE